MLSDFEETFEEDRQLHDSHRGSGSYAHCSDCGRNAGVKLQYSLHLRLPRFYPVNMLLRSNKFMTFLPNSTSSKPQKIHFFIAIVLPSRAFLVGHILNFEKGVHLPRISRGCRGLTPEKTCLNERVWQLRASCLFRRERRRDENAAQSCVRSSASPSSSGGLGFASVLTIIL
ncbi:hypothetical protein CPB83DRAFT_864320 [Crepidotus variabilis]|uniref:Uncharacterized protein n=1 Tax=Crepidotus variabilis TaxID=179855 RepID=A0A9P6E4P9_9AGAR|nr:hypothetical protein CPB83DRAFT_864320 [Crepidotus variabilis]